MTVRGITMRLVVDDLEAAIAFYEQLTDEAATRSRHGPVAVAQVGGFLLLSGPETAIVGLTRVRATVLVDDLERVADLVAAHGGEVLAGPDAGQMVARHPDGAIFEYVARS